MDHVTMPRTGDEHFLGVAQTNHPERPDE